MIKDVTAYNRDHGAMWIINGVFLIFLYMLFVPFKNVDLSALAFVMGILFGLIAVVVCHSKISKKYLI